MTTEHQVCARHLASGLCPQTPEPACLSSEPTSAFWQVAQVLCKTDTLLHWGVVMVKLVSAAFRTGGDSGTPDLLRSSLGSQRQPCPSLPFRTGSLQSLPQFCVTL